MNRTSFDHPVSELHLSTYKTADVTPALKKFLKLATERTEAILSIPTKERTYENTIQALFNSTEELDFLNDIVDHLAATLSGDWQEKEEEVSQAISEFYTSRSLNLKLFKAVKSVWDKRYMLHLTAAKVRSTDDFLTYLKRNGVELPEAKRKRIKAIKLELTKLSTEFSQNVVKANDEAALLIKTKKELAGVPEHQVLDWEKAAKNKQQNGYFIQFNAPNYQTIMTYCDIKATRDAMHRLSRSRAPHNESVARRILSLRSELAKILGYASYADYIIERRMAKQASRAQSFIDELTHAYRQTMLDETKALAEFAREHTEDPNYTVDFTDVDGGSDLYFANKLRHKQYGTDASIRIEEYFPIQSVLDVMFDALTQLYGVQFKPAEPEAYHEDVTSYQVFDEDGQHVATVWCDWFARNGKRPGAWQHSIYVADRAGGKTDKPHLGFVCANFARPTGDRPSLLNLTDVETLWHEFGHFMHMSLGRTELREQNGYGCVWDFIEAPSQIMENWVWQDEILDKMAKHYETGKALPKEYIQKLRESRSFRAASNAMWTLFWSQADMYLHSVFDTNSKVGLNDIARKIKSGYFGVAVAPYDNTICTFNHIFAGGYAAGYYGYKWAESIESDLFSRFEKEGILNAETGRAYRDLILARGDEIDAEQEVKDFLGRPTNIDAMLKRDNITQQPRRLADE